MTVSVAPASTIRAVTRQPSAPENAMLAAVREAVGRLPLGSDACDTTIRLAAFLDRKAMEASMISLDVLSQIPAGELGHTLVAAGYGEAVYGGFSSTSIRPAEKLVDMKRFVADVTAQAHYLAVLDKFNAAVDAYALGEYHGHSDRGEKLQALRAAQVGLGEALEGYHILNQLNGGAPRPSHTLKKPDQRLAESIKAAITEFKKENAPAHLRQ